MLAAGKNGYAHHTLPRVDQHFQHHHFELAQRGGHDGHFGLDDRLHLLRVRGPRRIRLLALEEEEKLSEKEANEEDVGGGGTHAQRAQGGLQVQGGRHVLGGLSSALRHLQPDLLAYMLEGPHRLTIRGGGGHWGRGGRKQLGDGGLAFSRLSPVGPTSPGSLIGLG
jgi:hypothetical protein